MMKEKKMLECKYLNQLDRYLRNTNYSIFDNMLHVFYTNYKHLCYTAIKYMHGIGFRTLYFLRIDIQILLEIKHAFQIY